MNTENKPETRHIEFQNLQKDFQEISKRRITTNIKLAKATSEYYRRPTDDSHDAMWGALDESFNALNAYQKTLTQALAYNGFPNKPPQGHARLFRGVKWPWDPEKNLVNSYWTEDPDRAAVYTEHGDMVAIDIPEESIYRIKDPTKEGEIQIPNPDDTSKAILIVRNHKLVLPYGKQTSPKLKNLLRSLLKDPNTRPKDYDKLHDEYIESGQEPV